MTSPSAKEEIKAGDRLAKAMNLVPQHVSLKSAGEGARRTHSSPA